MADNRDAERALDGGVPGHLLHQSAIRSIDEPAASGHDR